MAARVKRILRRFLPGASGAAPARDETLAVGGINFGSLRRVVPVSRQFGFDRGTPVDRYYIDKFLAAYAADIRGNVLEIGDDSYTRRFGGSRVVRTDILHVTPGNPKATIIADITSADSIPSAAFDCILFLQTLHLIYDVRAAIKTLHRILKPHGVLLATFPGISQKSTDEWGSYWQWGFTRSSAQRLFEEVFPSQAVTTHAYGNVLAAISFLEGIATEELTHAELDHTDPVYELLIGIRACKHSSDGSGQQP